MSHLSKGCHLPNHEARRLLWAQTEARKPNEEPKSYKQLGQKLGSWSRPHPFFFWVSAMQNIIFGVGPYFMAVSFKREWVRVSPKQPGLSSFQSCDHHVREDRWSDAPRALVRLPWLGCFPLFADRIRSFSKTSPVTERKVCGKTVRTVERRVNTMKTTTKRQFEIFFQQFLH